jgi:hypothetical protein
LLAEDKASIKNFIIELLDEVGIKATFDKKNEKLKLKIPDNLQVSINLSKVLAHYGLANAKEIDFDKVSHLLGNQEEQTEFKADCARVRQGEIFTKGEIEKENKPINPNIQVSRPARSPSVRVEPLAAQQPRPVSVKVEPSVAQEPRPVSVKVEPSVVQEPRPVSAKIEPLAAPEPRPVSVEIEPQAKRQSRPPSVKVEPLASQELRPVSVEIKPQATRQSRPPSVVTGSPSDQPSRSSVSMAGSKKDMYMHFSEALAKIDIQRMYNNHAKQKTGMKGFKAKFGMFRDKHRNHQIHELQLKIEGAQCQLDNMVKLHSRIEPHAKEEMLKHIFVNLDKSIADLQSQMKTESKTSAMKRVLSDVSDSVKKMKVEAGVKEAKRLSK